MNLPSPSIIDGIDSRVDVPVEKDEAVERTLEQYKKILPAAKSIDHCDNLFSYYLSSDIQPLAPVQIDVALQRLIQTPDNYEIRTYDRILGLYVSALIQKSYDVGHNGFVLHTQDTPLHYLCGFVEGQEGRLLDIIVYGDTGKDTGSNSKWCSMKHEGNAGHYYFYKAKHAGVFISGMIERFPISGSKDVLFRTTNPETFSHVQNCVMQPKYEADGHKLFLVDASGKALDAWNYSAGMILHYPQMRR